MTRHERMGTIAVLAIVAVLLLGSFLLNHYRATEASPQLMEEVNEFEAELDSVASLHDDAASKAEHRIKKTPKSRKKKSNKSKSKPSHHSAPPKMDPVPQF